MEVSGHSPKQSLDHQPPDTGGWEPPVSGVGETNWPGRTPPRPQMYELSQRHDYFKPLTFRVVFITGQ